jgi:hypothetical protein
MEETQNLNKAKNLKTLIQNLGFEHLDFEFI